MSRVGRRFVVVAGPLAAAAILSVTTVLAAGTGAVVRDPTHVLSQAQLSGVSAAAGTIAADGVPVLVQVQAESTTAAATVSEAASLMGSADIESSAGARDGLVVLVDLQPGDERHGTAAIYGGQHLTDGRLPLTELSRIYDDVMSPALRNGDLGGALTSALAAVHQDLVSSSGQPSQANRIAAAATIPLDVAALALLLIVFVVSRRLRADRNRLTAPVTPTTVPPSQLPPAIAGAVWKARPAPSLMLATVFDLARRGALIIEASGRRDQVIRLIDPTRLNGPWEGALWRQLVALADRRDGTIPARKLSAVRRHFAEFRDLLVRDLQDQGLYRVDADREARPIRWLAWLARVLVVAELATVWVGQQGWAWAGIVIASVAAWVGFNAATNVSRNTEWGLDAAAGWEGFRRGLVAAAKPARDQRPPAVDLDACLAYAIALECARDIDPLLRWADANGFRPLWLGQATAADAGFYGTWLGVGGFGGSSSGISGGSVSGGDGGAGGAAAGGGGVGGSF